jgi:hypothetical protein
MPKFDTPTREVASCERCYHLSPRQWLHVEGTDKERSQTRIAISGIGSLEKRSRGSSTHELGNREMQRAFNVGPTLEPKVFWVI